MPRTRTASLRVELLEDRRLLASELHLDFGGPRTPTAAGTTAVPLVAYTPAQGYGWESLRGMTWRDRATADPRTRDFHSAADRTFLANVPNGNYRVSVGLGDPRGRQERVSVWAEGERVVADLNLDYGATTKKTFDVTVRDGLLNLRLASGSWRQGFALSDLDIVPLAPPPPPPTPPDDHDDHDRDDPTHTPHDAIPNFGATPTTFSVRGGAWSDAQVWSAGRVPSTGDVVAIMPGTTVVYDVVSAARLAVVVVRHDATLSFRTDATTELNVATLVVHPEGTLRVGSAVNPVAAGVTATIRFTDTRTDPTFDPKQYGTGLVGLGTVDMHGASLAKTFVRLAAEPRAGDIRLSLAEPVTGWRPGDRLTLPDTRQLRGNEREDRYVPQWEELTLQAVSADGRTLTLTRPLAFHHLGARDGTGAIRFQGHVANLTRNVVLRSENPAGTRGHVFLAHEANVDLEYVAFRDLGRTRIDPLDSTTLDAAGSVTRLGTNQIGRYPLHVHHLMGPESPQGNGYQFTLIGNAIDGGTEAHSFKWGIAIHDSHYGLVKNNVLYNVAGAGVVTEDGSESFNRIEGNYVMRVVGTGMRPDRHAAQGDFGHEGNAYWFRGTNNFIVGNVAADVVNSYGYIFFMVDVGAVGNTVKIPARQGADMTKPNGFRTVDMTATPLLQFERNEVYGATANGMSLWYLGADIVRTRAIGTSTIKDFVVWHQTAAGLFGYPNKNLVLDGFTVLGNGQGSSNDISTGIFFSDYLTENLTVRRADIQGVNTGIVLPSKVGDTMNTGQATIRTTIENSYFRTLSEGVLATTLWGITGGGDHLPARETVLRNVRFDRIGAFSRDIRMVYLAQGRSGLNLTQKDLFFIYDHNGVRGDNFQVFYKEQAADFVVPRSAFDVVASPEAGLTNAQAWAKYRLAVAGTVASAKQTRDGIEGFVYRLTA